MARRTGLLLRLGRLAILAFLDFCALIGWPVRGSSEVLLVRLDAIGDFVLWLDAAQSLRQLYPDRRIVLCANSVWAELARELPFWDEVIDVDLARFSTFSWYRLAMLRRIRRRCFELAIQPVYSRVFLHGDAVIRASGAVQRLGSAGDLSNIHPRLKQLSDRWYTRLVPAASGLLSELERNAEFLSGSAGRAYSAALPRLPFNTELAGPLQVGRPYFIAFPGASWSGRRWPAEAYAAVMERIARRHALVPVLCGSGQDHALCEQIRQCCSVPALNLAGASSLPQLAELIRRAELLVGNETSAVHLAAAVDTPSVCVLGGGHYGRFLPYPDAIEGARPLCVYHAMPCYGCGWRCTQAHRPGEAVPCIGAVTVDQVCAAVEQALAAAAARPRARGGRQ